MQTASPSANNSKPWYVTALSRLVERGVLPEGLNQSSLTRLHDEKANLAAHCVALISALAMLLAFAGSVYDEPRVDRTQLLKTLGGT